MQTDTVVGIVGAVVLVSVMVGVFAYEYNATDSVDNNSGPNVSMATFNETYPGLSATGDMDSDGIPNHEDSDIDGDNTPDADDDQLTFTADLSGTVAASVASVQSDTKTFHVDEGATAIRISITYDRPLPLPDAVGAQPGLNFGLVDPVGQSYDGVQSPTAAGSSTVTITYDLASAPFLAGDWTFSASSNLLVAPAMSYTADLSVDYDA